MPRQVFVFDPPERFVVGTVGQPGERTFFLQARAGSVLVSAALEKQQVSLLADRLEALLENIDRYTGEAHEESRADSDPLETPITEEFRVSALAIGYDAESDIVLIEAHGAGEDDETEVTEIPDDEPGPPVIRARLTPGQAQAFVRRSRSVVSAGRPPCPFCSLPLDPRGHICPRANGYRRSG